MKSLEDAPVTGKRVLLRLGLDVPMSSESPPKVVDDIRLREAIPTIQFLLDREATLVTVGHLGRPGGKPLPSLSLRPVFERLSELLNHSILFCPTVLGQETEAAIEGLTKGGVIGVENLRFEPGEDQDSRTFAQALANYGELYVNDAFSAYHPAASTIAITEFLPAYAGLLFEKEYNVLTNLLRHPASPFVAVIGGAKASDKLPVIHQLLEKADWVLVGGQVANVFAAAENPKIKNVEADATLLETARQINARSRGKLVLPVDGITSPEGAVMDIGPKTIQAFSGYLKGARTIFWNGNVGKSEDERYRHGSDSIAKLIADSGATTIVGGGNTVEIITRLGLASEISFVSSGGGAALKLLSGEVLPTVQALG